MQTDTLPSAASRSGYILTDQDRRKRLGRVQRQIRRCLIALGRPVKIRDLLKWCYPHATEFEPWMRTHIHATIKRVAKPIGKTRERFATTWQLRTTPNYEIGTKQDKTRVKSMAEHH